MRAAKLALPNWSTMTGTIAPRFSSEAIRIRIHVRFAVPTTNPVFGVIIHDAAGIPLSGVQSINGGLHTGRLSSEAMVEGYFRKLSLYPGRYFLSPWITDSARQRSLDCPRMCATFDFHPSSGEWWDLRLSQEWGKVYISSAMEDPPDCPGPDWDYLAMPGGFAAVGPAGCEWLNERAGSKHLLVGCHNLRHCTDSKCVYAGNAFP